MKKTLALLIILALTGAVVFLGIKRFAPGLLAKQAPANTETARQDPAESPVIGTVWDTNIQERLSPPSQEPPPKPFTPPKPNTANVAKPAQDTLVEGETQAAWPGTEDQPPALPTKTQAETTVKVGDQIVPNTLPPTAEVLLPLDDKTRSEVIDPREADRLLGLSEKDTKWEKMSPEEKLEQEHEPTNIAVQRTFIAVLPNGEKQTIRVKVPVVYKSRTLRLNEVEAKKARELVARAKALEINLQTAKKESEEILKEWNRIWKTSIPSTALMPESPSLPENQSNSELNRPNPNPDLVPGKSASFEIK